MTEEEDSIEPVSLITKDFPIVVIKENAELSDDERAQLLDRLDELLETGRPHALILDLTGASELPEVQRVFISESLQLRSELVEAMWISVAIVVSNNNAASGELASFWQKATPGPTQVFTNMMSAVVSTRQSVEKYTRAAREGDEPGVPSIRPSDPSPRRSEVSARRPEVQNERPTPRARATRPNKVQHVSATRRVLRSPVTWLALLSAIACAGLFMLNSSFEAGLSASEQEAFQKRKDKFAVRVFRKVGRKRVPILPGEPCPAGSSLRFEADLPSRAYMMILGARSDQETYVGWAEHGKQSFGPLALGRVILSASVDLTFDEGREWLHFVACSERITTDACKFQSAKSLKCPENCTVSTFQIDKAAAGS